MYRRASVALLVTVLLLMTELSVVVAGTQADSDEDGWPDVIETMVGTDPYNPDTDGDGILDSIDPTPL
ncbi:MAG: hypothetical protein KAQ96_03865, partial [Thermoplasmata archaeon]|nr:hypothetical protein [Thermoplasmata archaeon]